MSEGALYLKYRPFTLADVVGQSDVVKLFGNLLKNDNISHAYLFAGERGTGKTSVARIVARELKTSKEDIFEIDAASNRGIEEIRILRDGVMTLPFSSKYKIYIIDEAHMLTTQAANALLKTLEEPPEHVIFILATTDPEKLPKTIRSRCQLVVFKRAEDKDIEELIKKVCQSENIEIDDDSAKLISKNADGSYRDALSILEGAIARSDGKKILFGNTSQEITNTFEIATEILESVSACDTNNALKLCASQDANTLSIDLLEVLRTALLIRFDKNTEFESEAIKKYGTDIASRIKKIGLSKERPFNSSDLLKAIENLQKIQKDSALSKVYLEQLIISLSE